VRPEYQRKGIGTEMLKQGIQRADDEGLLMYLEAMPKGLELYKRFGFVEVDRVEVDLSKYGGKEGQWSIFVLMMRTPQMQ